MALNIGIGGRSTKTVRGGRGVDYTAGEGISIDDNEIGVDFNTVASVTSVYELEEELTTEVANRKESEEVLNVLIDEKLDTPSTVGTAGQVLTLDDDLNPTWADTQGGSSMISITYAELKTLRGNGELVPGTQYRITDYQCTTNQQGTQSAGHQFDIIVTALDEHTLSEDAKAISHPIWDVLDTDYLMSFKRDTTIDGTYSDQDYYYGWSALSGTGKIFTEKEHPLVGDTVKTDLGFNIVAPMKVTGFSSSDYFANSNLAAWELKYCFDNDINRFSWAQQLGVGDSYFLYEYTGNSTIIDDTTYYIYHNDVALFRELYALSPNVEIGDKFYYLEGGAPTEWMTVEVVKNPKGVIYYMKDEFGNECPYDFKNIQFKRWWNGSKSMWSETEDTGETGLFVYTFNSEAGSTTIAVTDSSIEGYVKRNAIKGVGLSNNVFFVGNIMSSHSFNNVLSEDCSNNTFDVGCNDNILGCGCTNNTFGKMCNYNNLGADCDNNTFGDNISNKHIEYTSSFSYAASLGGSTSEFLFGEKNVAFVPKQNSYQPLGGMLPDEVYNLGELSGTITFSLAAAVSGNVNHYFFTFSTGATAPTITWPNGITWQGGSAPTINASKHYEVSILNGYGVAMEV